MKIEILKERQGLSYLAGINREITPGQVTKIATSCNRMGLIRPVVTAVISFISGKPTRYILDGQHLFNALLRNGMPIEYITIEVKDMRDLVEKIALLNSSSKSWTLANYLTPWSNVSNEYKKLQHYYNIYDFDLGLLTAILSSKIGDGGNITRMIKDGSFQVVDEQENVKILDCLTDILTIIPRMDRMQNKYVCSEYIKFLRTSRKYNHAAFLVALKANKQKFMLATQQPEKLSEMFKKLSN